MNDKMWDMLKLALTVLVPVSVVLLGSAALDAASGTLRVDTILGLAGVLYVLAMVSWAVTILVAFRRK